MQILRKQVVGGLWVIFIVYLYAARTLLHPGWLKGFFVFLTADYLK